MAFQQGVCISPSKIFTQSIDQMAFYYDHICEKSFCQGILNFKCGILNVVLATAQKTGKHAVNF